MILACILLTSLITIVAIEEHLNKKYTLGEEWDFTRPISKKKH